MEDRRRKVRSTMAAGVRGDPQAGADPAQPEFKGTRSEKRSVERLAERQELSSAVDLVLGGKLDAAAAALGAFVKAHPKSSFLPDAREAREKVEQLKREPAAPAPATGAKAQ